MSIYIKANKLKKKLIIINRNIFFKPNIFKNIWEKYYDRDK